MFDSDFVDLHEISELASRGVELIIRAFVNSLIFIGYQLTPNKRRSQFLTWFVKRLLPDPGKAKRQYRGV